MLTGGEQGAWQAVMRGGELVRAVKTKAGSLTCDQDQEEKEIRWVNGKDNVKIFESAFLLCFGKIRL